MHYNYRRWHEKSLNFGGYTSISLMLFSYKVIYSDGGSIGTLSPIKKGYEMLIDKVLKRANKRKLKPCPFCGGDAEEGCVDSDMFFVICSNLGCSVNVFTLPKNTKQQAIQAWNERKG